MTTAAVVAATKTIAMTTLQKTVVTIALAAAVGTGSTKRVKLPNYMTRSKRFSNSKRRWPNKSRNCKASGTRPQTRQPDLLPQNPSEMEILRLRGEIGVLRRRNEELKLVPIEGANQFRGCE